MSFLRAVTTVGGYTAISRLLGFVRDIFIAAALGAGPIADAFFIAFRLPNFFRQLFGEGAFNSAFVPMFAGTIATRGKAAAVQFAEQTLSILLAVLIAVTILGELFMTQVIQAIAIGFDDALRFDLAVELTRITFPYLLFICLSALYSGVLNSLGRFAAPAATPILLNVTMIGAALGLTALFPTAGHALAWGIVAAGVIQFIWLAASARAAGANLHLPLPRLTPEVRELLRRMVPGVFGAGVVQVNLLIGTQLATLLPTGSVSYLYYADRLNQLPLAIVATAIGTALLPLLTRQIQSGETKAANNSQNRALEFALIMTIPAAVGLMVLARPIIEVLFERGAFGAAETEATALALIAFVAGLPAYALIKVFTPAFFARGDTKTPVRIAAFAVVANTILNIALMLVLDHVGIALGTAIASWLNAGALCLLLIRRGLFSADMRLRRRGPRLILAGALMAVLLQIALEVTQPWFDGSPLAVRALLLGGLIGFGGMVFFALANMLGGVSLAELVARLRRRRA